MGIGMFSMLYISISICIALYMYIYLSTYLQDRGGGHVDYLFLVDGGRGGGDGLDLVGASVGAVGGEGFGVRG
jgi:hypothetical protein